MKWYKKYIPIILSLMALSPPVAKAQSTEKGWTEAKSISGNFKAVSSQPELEVFSAPRTVMLKVNRECEIRLFTILGKLVSSQKLSPGIYEYRIDTHGIYIIKTDENSCKVAI